MRRILLLAVAMLLLAGCSSHPPSAAAFMSMKENGASIVVGATARVGDNHEEGRVGDYHHGEGYWNFDFSMLGRFVDLLITGIAFENYTPRGIFGAHSRYVGFQGWGGVSIHAVDYENNPVFGGMMLMEEYPVNEYLRVGLSEYVSRNAYSMKDLSDFLPAACSGFYGEIGAGVYMTFRNLSLEFRYGRELENPNNRFYFTLNYQFQIIRIREKKEK